MDMNKLLSTILAITGSLLLASVTAVEPAHPTTGDKDAATSTPSTATPAPAATLSLRYKPPRLGAPKDRVGGGSRGEKDTLIVETLAPEQIGWCMTDQPVLYWYLSQPAKTHIEVTVADDQAIEPLLEATVKKIRSPGIQSLNLREHNVHLLPGKEYRWSVALIQDENNRSSDIVSSASLAYHPPTKSLTDIIKRSNKAALPAILADHGYWYDAIDSLSRAIAAQSGNRHLREQRAELLRQVDLPTVARYELQ